MSQTSENRWSDTMAIIVISVVVNGKRKMQDGMIPLTLEKEVAMETILLILNCPK